MASEYHDRIASQLTYARQALLDSPAYKCRGLLYRSSGVATLISVASLLLLFALVLHATLPSRSASVSFLRFLCWPLTLFILWPIVQDRGEKYTLGNDFRDIAIPAFAWLPLSEMTRVCFVSLWDSYEDRAPRWIVPLSQAHKWGITGDVAQEKEQRVTPTYGSAAAHHKHDVDDDNSAGRGKYAKEGSIPSQWVVVPHAPFFSWRRFLWAIDNMTLRRPGTSFLFPAQQRSLEWSLPVLRKTSGIYAESEAQKYTQDDDFIRSHSPVWFGVSEWGFIYSAFHMAFLVQFYRFITLLDLSIQKGTYHPVDFYGLPLHMQYFLTFGLGALVVFPTSSIDCIIHFVLKQVLRWPVTAICPAFQRPLFASGPTDFWNRRWHQFLRRDFSAIAKLVPGSRESGIVRLVATFAVSGAEHSEWEGLAEKD